MAVYTTTRVCLYHPATRMWLYPKPRVLDHTSDDCTEYTYSPISHNQWTQVGTGQTPVGASHLRAILIQRLS